MEQLFTDHFVRIHCCSPKKIYMSIETNKKTPDKVLMAAVDGDIPAGRIHGFMRGLLSKRLLHKAVPGQPHSIPLHVHNSDACCTMVNSPQVAP